MINAAFDATYATYLEPLVSLARATAARDAAQRSLDELETTIESLTRTMRAHHDQLAALRAAEPPSRAGLDRSRRESAA